MIIICKIWERKTDLCIRMFNSCEIPDQLRCKILLPQVNSADCWIFQYGLCLLRGLHNSVDPLIRKRTDRRRIHRIPEIRILRKQSVRIRHPTFRDALADQFLTGFPAQSIACGYRYKALPL